MKKLQLFIIFFIFFLLNSSRAFAEDSLLLHINFNDDFKDNSKNNQKIYLSGNVQIVGNGVEQNCAKFDKGNLTIKADSNFYLGNSFTISCWIKADDALEQSLVNGSLISKNNYGDSEFDLFLKGTNSLNFSRLYSSDLRGNIEFKGLYLGEKWSHIAISSDGKSFFLYVDGVLKKTEIIKSDLGKIVNSNNNILIGKNYLDDFFYGYMDELKIYNYKLSDNQIKSDFDKIKVASNKIKLKIGDKNLYLNDVPKEIDEGRGTTPVIKNGRTLVPIRSIIESMNGNVVWQEKEKKIDVNLKDKKISLWIDKNYIEVNGMKKEIDVSPTIINDRTMIPIRIVSENLGATVEWKEIYGEVIITF